jgi:NhaA family Na+:H+ antiporter
MSGASTSEQRWLSRFLRDETVGGGLMICAAVLAIIFANSPAADLYNRTAMRTLSIPQVHLSMTVAQWAADFLLALFFLIAGAELKHELVLGSLSSRKRALAPLSGAVGGMVMSALVFLATTSLMGGDHLDRHGWAIPTSTDIAFALAILAIIGRGTAPAIRVLLLSVAVINDLGSILIIGALFASDFRVLALAAALVFIALWWVMQQLGVRSLLAYAPVFLLAWYFMHASGVHATVAGMALGLATKATRVERNPRSGVELLEHWLRPVVAAVAVPLFAFFAAGIDVRGTGTVSHLGSPLAIAIICGLVIGQPSGVFLGTWLAVKARFGEIHESLRWVDVAVASSLAAMGFTVALLVTSIAYPWSESRVADSKMGIVVAVICATGLSVLVTRYARGTSERESLT